MLRRFFLWVLLGSSTWAWAQAPMYAVVTESMLANSDGHLITDMALDTNGLLWVTTENEGILRYDGERFNRMDRAPENPDDERYYSAICMLRPKLWLAGGDGVYIWKGGDWERSAYPENSCVDLLNTGMGRIYALSPSRVYYRGLSEDTWTEESVPGLSGAYQMAQKEGIVLIASESGLWMRSPSGLWTQLLDEPVSSAMPLGKRWMAITDAGLKILGDEGWTVMEPLVRGYHSFVTTADGQNTWLMGESGLWYVRQDGVTARLYTHGGLELETLRQGISSDAGGLFVATEKGLLRMDAPERWFDLRTLPFRIGPISHVAAHGTDSCWVATSLGIYSLGPEGIRNHGKPGTGLVSGLTLHQGAWAYGEFGLYRFRSGQWENMGLTTWVTDVRWKMDSLFVLQNGQWSGALASRTPRFQPVTRVPASAEMPSTPRWIQDVYGLAIESLDRAIGRGMKPSLLIRSVERRTKKENDPVVIKVGFRGLPQAGNGIPLEYQIDGGDWISMGSNRRLTLERLRAGQYQIRFRATGPRGDLWGQPTVAIEVLPAAWKRPSFWVPALALMLFLLGMAGVIAWRRARDRATWNQEKAELERMALRLQMNPHFTFNALESISAFILEKQPKEAVTYLNKFSRLMRYTLESAEDSHVSLAREQEALENYIALEQMRFDQGFHSVFQVEEGLDTQSLIIAPMLVQPLVENAILHGLRPKIKDGQTDGVLKIYVGHDAQGPSLLIQVEDNGIGREAAKKQKSGDEGEKRSAATRILQSRLSALQVQTGRPHSMVVEDLNDGTRVTLVLPLNHEWSEND